MNENENLFQIAILPGIRIFLYPHPLPLTPAAWTALRDAQVQDEITVVVIELESFEMLTLGLPSRIAKLYEKQTFKAD